MKSTYSEHNDEKTLINEIKWRAQVNTRECYKDYVNGAAATAQKVTATIKAIISFMD